MVFEELAFMDLPKRESINILLTIIYWFHKFYFPAYAIYF